MTPANDQPPRAARAVATGEPWAFLGHRTLQQIVDEEIAKMASPSSIYRDLVEVIAMVGAQILHAQDEGGDPRDNDEIGEEILRAVKFPGIRAARDRLREASIDRRFDAPLPALPAGPAIVLKLRAPRQ
jgi:hypothetical protein